VIRISRGIIKLARGRGSNLEDYRYYCIARQHYALRSGIFSLDEFCDLLHSEYEYVSLHRKPGNDRTRFKQRLIKILQGSILFAELLDGRYKTNSEKSLLSRFNKGHNKSMWYELPDKKILSSKKEFFDFCVGSLLAGGRFRANKNIAQQCGVSVRRIQFATSRNNKNRTFIKRYNFLEDFSGSSKDVEKFRAILFNVHGISSPLPRKSKKEWVVRLNAPNTYRANMLCGVKGDRAHPMVVNVSKKEVSWFIPAFETGKSKLVSDYSDDKRWIFNDGVYNTNRYIQDNSKYLS
jgi:hypothetical protein